MNNYALPLAMFIVGYGLSMLVQIHSVPKPQQTTKMPGSTNKPLPPRPVNSDLDDYVLIGNDHIKGDFNLSIEVKKTTFDEVISMLGQTNFDRNNKRAFIPDTAITLSEYNEMIKRDNKQESNPN